MSSEPVYYSRLNGKIGRARPLEDFICDGSYTPLELRQLEVRRTGTENWEPLSSLFDSKWVPLPAADSVETPD